MSKNQCRMKLPGVATSMKVLDECIPVIGICVVTVRSAFSCIFLKFGKKVKRLNVLRTYEKVWQTNNM